MDNKMKINGKVIRDEKGRIIRLEGFPQEAILIPFIDTVRNSVEQFDENTVKYSKRMEKLTIVVLILAIAQFSLAIVTIALIAQ